MFSYRDMTFCEFKSCENYQECHRALTDEVQKSAEKWAKDAGLDDVPVQDLVRVFAKSPSCYMDALSEQAQELGMGYPKGEDNG